MLQYRQLSGAALSALQDFYRDRDAQEKNFEDLKSAIKESEQNTKLSMETFTEDWNTSQFWVYFLVQFYLFISTDVFSTAMRQR